VNTQNVKPGWHLSQLPGQSNRLCHPETMAGGQTLELVQLLKVDRGNPAGMIG
jgi:hypothetical protein